MPSPQLPVHGPHGDTVQATQGLCGQVRVLMGLLDTAWQWKGRRGRLLWESMHWTSRCLNPAVAAQPSGHLLQLPLCQVVQGRRRHVRAGSGLFMLAQSSSSCELQTTVLHMAPIPHVVEHSLQFPMTQNISKLTGSLASRSDWLLAEPRLPGLRGCCWFGFLGRLLLDQEEGFLVAGAELFLLGPAEGFFILMILMVERGAAAVAGFLTVVGGGSVERRRGRLVTVGAAAVVPETARGPAVVL